MSIGQEMLCTVKVGEFLLKTWKGTKYNITCPIDRYSSFTEEVIEY